MDPIKTAVKFALIPLRVVVQLGELYVGGSDGRQQPQPPQEEPAQPQAKPAAKRAGKQQPAAGRQRPKADPQASSAPKDLDDVGLARKVESVIFRDSQVPK